MAVREALLHNPATLRRVLALILHTKVRKEALAIRHDANGTDLHADHHEGFTSAARDILKQKRTEVDPFGDTHSLDEAEAYMRLHDVTDAQLDQLICLLVVESITAHLLRPTPLVRMLAQELGVNVRRYWRPDAEWLNRYQKVQLAHLVGVLWSPALVQDCLRRKKSELVGQASQAVR